MLQLQRRKVVSPSPLLSPMQLFDSRNIFLKAFKIFFPSLYLIKHNTYPPIKTLDCITSIVKNQSNMVIRVFIWVNSITQEFYSWNIFWVLIRIFIWVNSITQEFYSWNIFNQDVSWWVLVMFNISKTLSSYYLSLIVLIWLK